jgi:hypothetical protein
MKIAVFWDVMVCSMFNNILAEYLASVFWVEQYLCGKGQSMICSTRKGGGELRPRVNQWEQCEPVALKGVTFVDRKYEK